MYNPLQIYPFPGAFTYKRGCPFAVSSFTIEEGDIYRKAKYSGQGEEGYGKSMQQEKSVGRRGRTDGGKNMEGRDVR